jgi:hypothetical protein
MKRILFFAFFSGLLFNGAAQEKDSPNMQNESRPSGDFLSIQMAYDLAQYGYANKDAVSLLNAARIMSSITVRDANARGIIATDKAQSNSKPDTAKKQAIQLDLLKLLNDARSFSANDKTTLDYINAMAKNINAQSRGRVGGSVVISEVVKAYDTDIYSIEFYGTESARIAVKGDGDTDLDLYIYDANGYLIASDADYTDGCFVQFTPKWTGRFSIRIKNRGSVYNRYALATN